MAAPLETTPLFLLNTVLFPLAKIQLHVFEPRYRELIRYCLQHDCGFGIVLIREGEEVGETADPYLVGTLVKIHSVHTYDDGHMDVQVVGERRFRIRQLNHDRPYLVGMTEAVSEVDFEPESDPDPLDIRVRMLVQEYIETHFRLLGMQVATIKLPMDPTALSFVVANFLQVDDREKQVLLEISDTRERLNRTLPILEQQLQDLQHQDPLHYEGEPYRMTTSDFSDFIVPN